MNAEPVKEAPGRSLLLLIVAFGLGLVVVAFIGASRARFRHLIEEFEIAPPLLTSFALGAALPVLLGLLLVATAAKECVPGQARMKNLWHAIVIGVTLAFLAVYIAGVFSPVMMLIESLS